MKLSTMPSYFKSKFSALELIQVSVKRLIPPMRQVSARPEVQDKAQSRFTAMGLDIITSSSPARLHHQSTVLADLFELLAIFFSALAMQ
ncbi:protein of unknown function [Pseudomonas mediterranea]